MNAPLARRLPALPFARERRGRRVFQGGTLCARTPLERTAPQGSGGAPRPPSDGSGTYLFDVDAHLQDGADPSLVPGIEVHGQLWMGGPPASFTTGLSDALRFKIRP